MTSLYECFKITTPTLQNVLQFILSCHFRDFLTNPETGQLFRQGDIIKQTRLANTLDKIAEKGGDEYYNGELADEIAADLKEKGNL